MTLSCLEQYRHRGHYLHLQFPLQLQRRLALCMRPRASLGLAMDTSDVYVQPCVPISGWQGALHNLTHARNNDVQAIRVHWDAKYPRIEIMPHWLQDTMGCRSCECDISLSVQVTVTIESCSKGM